MKKVHKKEIENIIVRLIAQSPLNVMNQALKIFAEQKILTT